MSPKELRAFRESLGFSRRQFAPKLFISEPTLERWERGQGKPGDVQLLILSRMRAHLGTGQPGADFQYDVGAEAVAGDMLRENRQLVVETLRGMGIVPLKGRKTKNGQDWWFRFGLGWATGEPIELVLACEGSERPMRPIIDFTLVAAADWKNSRELPDALRKICRDHRISWDVVHNDKGQPTIELYYRVFSTGCNSETVKHVIGNFGSCWRRIRTTLVDPVPSRSGALAARDGKASR